MSQILNSLLALIESHGLIAMLFGGLVEQIIVPIPSPIITMAGGAFLVKNLSDIFFQVAFPYTIGATIGTSFVFLIAYYMGKPVIDKFGKYIGVSWNLIEKIRIDFKKTIRDEVFIFFSCVIPVVPVSLISAFCGALKVSPKKFYPMVALALFFRASILAFVGYQMGEAFTGLAHGLDKIESVITVVGAIFILGFLFLKREKWLKKNE